MSSFYFLVLSQNCEINNENKLKTFVCIHRKQNSLSNAIYPDDFREKIVILGINS
jgi:hypothetical protein